MSQLEEVGTSGEERFVLNTGPSESGRIACSDGSPCLSTHRRRVTLSLSPRSIIIVSSASRRLWNSISSMPSHADSLINSRKASRGPNGARFRRGTLATRLSGSGNSTRATSTGNHDRWALDVFLYIAVSGSSRISAEEADPVFRHWTLLRLHPARKQTEIVIVAVRSIPQIFYFDSKLEDETIVRQSKLFDQFARVELISLGDRERAESRIQSLWKHARSSSRPWSMRTFNRNELTVRDGRWGRIRTRPVGVTMAAMVWPWSFYRWCERGRK